MTGNVFALFESRFPSDRTTTIIESPTRGAYAYGDAARWIDRFAAFLTASGATPGDRIAVQVDKSPEALFLYFACLKAGILAHVAGNAPAVSVEFARKTLMSTVRPTFAELEEANENAPAAT